MSKRLWILGGVAAVGLVGCGADEIVSPGTGGNITINNPPATTPPVVVPPSSNLVSAAAGCPTIANDPGLRDDGTITGTTGTYRVCTLPALLSRSSQLTRIAGLLYAMDGRVDVGRDCGPQVAAAGILTDCKATAAATAETNGITLTIDPGVIIFSKTGVSWLAVNRGHKINAVGTVDRPIVFTSRDNVLGLATDDSQGQWGGVVLHGRAPVTDCQAGGATPGSVTCERQTEGALDPALFGGATPADNSGTMRYVQIRYSGYVLSGNSELQSLTLGGVGSGTTIDHIDTHNSSDDGFEIFGGRVKLRHFVVTGADDDNIDVDTGYQGTIQYVIAIQKTSGAADSMIELDTAGTTATTDETQTPRTNLKLANFTLIHKNATAGNGAAIRMRGRADATLVNGIVTSPIQALRLDGPAILTADPAIQKLGPPAFKSVMLQSTGGAPFRAGDGGVTVQQAADTFNVVGNNNNAAFTNSLTNGYVNGASETGATATDPKTVDAAFDTTTYIGAVKDAADTWYAGWTCNSATANFGTTSSACTSLPSLN
jgi:hypothetical protein